MLQAVDRKEAELKARESELGAREAKLFAIKDEIAKEAFKWAAAQASDGNNVA